MRAAWIAVLAGLALGTAPAAADPGPADKADKADKSDKLDAKALMQSGLKLFTAKDFLGALAVFRTAYARFPSAKILLNIGTTLTKLDRKPEAANVYQRYLDASDADPAKRAEVSKVLAGLDAAIATLALSVTPADAELQVGDDDWLPGSTALYRVAAGNVTVRARRAGYTPGEQAVRATAGARQPVAIALVAIPIAPPPAAAPVAPTGRADDDGLHATVESPAARSPIGVIALAHVDPANRGAAGVIGVSYDATPRLAVQAAALLGPSSGGYAGARLALLDGALQPIVAAGLPIFASHGARVGVRAAGGVELAIGRHLALVAELGVEYLFNPEAGFHRTLFIPALGATGRL